MQKPQPTFTAEFKREAGQLAQSSSKSKAQIARELGISDSALYSWCKQLAEHGNGAFPSKGQIWGTGMGKWKSNPGELERCQAARRIHSNMLLA